MHGGFKSCRWKLATKSEISQRKTINKLLLNVKSFLSLIIHNTVKIYVFVFVKLCTIVNALALVVVLLKIDYTRSLILIYERWLVAERN